MKQMILSLFYLFFVQGCNAYRVHDYQGNVVDQKKQPIADVHVKVCYIGGLEFDTNHILVWGLLHCSHEVMTDSTGGYHVRFAAPKPAIVYAHKDGWVQVKDFLTNERIVLMAMRDYVAMVKQKREQKEKTFQSRKTGESDIAYYCRVVSKRSRVLEMTYKTEHIKILQSLLAGEKTILALVATEDTVQSIAKVLQITDDTSFDAKVRFSDFKVLPHKTACKKGLFLIEAVPKNASGIKKTTKELTAHIPSIKASFPLYVWKR